MKQFNYYKHRSKYLLTSLVLLFVCVFGSLGEAAQDASKLAKQTLAATVYLEITGTNENLRHFGSGFFVSPTYIVTNYHVLLAAGTAKGTVNLVNNQKKYPIQGLVAIDRENDLAILQVTIPGIKPLPLGDSDKMETGHTVYVAGNPKRLQGAFTYGLISAIREEGNKKRLQTDAAVSEGSSGSPMINCKGEVIGVIYMTRMDGQNLNFAIPSNYIKALLKKESHVEPIPPEEKYFHSGNYSFNMGAYEVAISEYSEAIRLKPNFANAYVNRASAKLQLGLYAEALKDCNNAIKVDPFAVAVNELVYYFRGRAKLELNKYGEAIKDFDIIIDRAPILWHAYYYRGKAKSGLAKYEAAIEDYNSAIIGLPDSANFYLARGDAKYFLRQYHKATVDYKIVIALEPDNHTTYFMRGNAHYRLGYTDLAESDWENALKLAKEADDVEFYEGVMHEMRELNEEQR